MLEEIDKLDNAIVFFDECETIFSSRDALAGYGSVMAETKKACIGAFLQWVNGLESQPSKRLLFCMATNKLENGYNRERGCRTIEEMNEKR